MPEKAAFFHFYSAFCFFPREISGLAPNKSAGMLRSFFEEVRLTNPYLHRCFQFLELPSHFGCGNAMDQCLSALFLAELETMHSISLAIILLADNIVVAEGVGGILQT